MIKKILPFLLIFSFVCILYYPMFTTYFSQDDFFHFKVSQTDGSFLGFIKLFGIYSFGDRSIAFYRPISREIPFNIFYSLFGLSVVPFRVFAFLIHLLNIYLVYYLLQSLLFKKSLSYFVAFFFGISAANVATLYYLAGGIQTLLVTTFTLLSLIFFHKYLKLNKLKYRVLSFVSFILAISSHEQAFIIPLLIVGLIITLKSSKDVLKYTWDLIPYFLIIFLLIYLEIFRIGFSSNEQQYQAIFNIKTTINSLFWYSNWALGIPEMLIDFIYPGLKLNPSLLKYWGNYYLFILPSYFISIILISFASLFILLRKRSIFCNKVFVFFLVWFPLSLLPIILLPQHKSTHYLTISLPAFWALVGYILFNSYETIKNKYRLFGKIFLTSTLISLIILSSVSAILGSTNYWASTRGRLAEKLINEIKTTYPSLPKGSKIYFKNDPTQPFLTKEWGTSSKQASFILNGNDALQLLYKDPTLRVYYETLGEPKSSDKNVFSLTAKIY